MYQPIRIARIALAFAISLSALIAAPKPSRADSPPNLSADIAWTAGLSGVNDVQTAFNNGRRQEEIQRGLANGTLGNLVMPTQAVWNTYGAEQKALFLLNAERVARAGFPPGVLGLPFQDSQVDVQALAQNYADLLVATNTFGHEQQGDPFDRIDNDPVLGPCVEFLSRAENIAGFWTGGTSNPLAVERAVYNWIYADAGSLWGHREGALLQDKEIGSSNPLTGFKNNVGSAGSEGFIGIGVAESAAYNPFGFGFSQWGTVVILVMIDPKSTGSCPWDLAPTPTPIPTNTPTHTPVPTNTPTATPMPPTVTPTATPTAAPVPPTATPVPPTATPVPPTATPIPPTATPIPPTATQLPPSYTPTPPTSKPQPAPA